MNGNGAPPSPSRSEPTARATDEPALAAKERSHRSRRRRSDIGPDVYQPHNRLPALALSLLAIGCAAAGLAVSGLFRQVHWASLVSHNVAVLLAITAAVLERSAARYWTIAAVMAAFVASMLLAR